MTPKPLDKKKAPPRTRFQRHFDLIAIGLALTSLIFMALATVFRSDDLSIWELALCAPFLLIPMIVAITIWVWDLGAQLWSTLISKPSSAQNSALLDDEIPARLAL